MKIKSIALTLFAALSIAFSANAQKTIVDVAVGSSDHTTLVAAVKAADNQVDCFANIHSKA